ncbi:MAG: hydroxyisourate hydrolase [Candidatus Dadabacteria bacterium]|nr:hydroxyisourate hydrolase [Candidatus Dadabacteria bacterium]
MTTHVLDTASGQPAAGVPVRLYVEEAAGAGSWQLLASGITDDDGRITDLLPSSHVLLEGVYRMRFNIAEYAEARDQVNFYPQADVQFRVAGESRHYHIPLLLSPYGYSTYRGS